MKIEMAAVLAEPQQGSHATRGVPGRGRARLGEGWISAISAAYGLLLGQDSGRKVALMLHCCKGRSEDTFGQGLFQVFDRKLLLD